MPIKLTRNKLGDFVKYGHRSVIGTALNDVVNTMQISQLKTVNCIVLSLRNLR